MIESIIMFKNGLNEALSASIGRHQNIDLGGFEQGVWNEIHSIQRENSASWYEKMLQAMSVWQFQASALVFSICLGFLVGISSSSLVSDDINLQVFSSNSPYLLSTKLSVNYEETLY